MKNQVFDAIVTIDVKICNTKVCILIGWIQSRVLTGSPDEWGQAPDSNGGKSCPKLDCVHILSTVVMIY